MIYKGKYLLSIKIYLIRETYLKNLYYIIYAFFFSYLEIIT